MPNSTTFNLCRLNNLSRYPNLFSCLPPSLSLNISLHLSRLISQSHRDTLPLPHFKTNQLSISTSSTHTHVSRGLSSLSLVMKKTNELVSSLIFIFIFFTLLLYLAAGNNVTYDHRSLIINGQRKLLISAAIHYPRSVPAVMLLYFSYTYIYIIFVEELYMRRLISY